MTETYNTLESINQRRLQLQGEINKEETKIRGLWNGLFHEKKKPLVQSPTQKLLHYASMSTGILDGALLGWKLYRKFKK